MAYKCDRKHNSDLKRRYKITRSVCLSILKGQEFRCTICKGHQDDVGTLVMEHDGKTSVLRGATCNGCNAVLGFSKDNPDILRAAIQYLESS